MLLSFSRLKEVLHYDPESGIFTWLIRPANNIIIGQKAGCTRKDGYLTITIDNSPYYAQRLAFLYMEGYFPEYEMDHRDRNPSNNKWNNLRHVTHVCNMKNCSKSKNNTSGVTGVYWNMKSQKWHSRIRVDKKLLHLGFFINFEKAVDARWKAEVEHGVPNCNTTSTSYQYLKGVKDVTENTW